MILSTFKFIFLKKKKPKTIFKIHTKKKKIAGVICSIKKLKIPICTESLIVLLVCFTQAQLKTLEGDILQALTTLKLRLDSEIFCISSNVFQPWTRRYAMGSQYLTDKVTLLFPNKPSQHIRIFKYSN